MVKFLHVNYSLILNNWKILLCDTHNELSPFKKKTKERKKTMKKEQKKELRWEDNE